MIYSGKICLEASTICQLGCTSCPSASGETGKFLGSNFLKYDDFKTIIDSNTCISSIELSNWGEIFLNPELSEIIQYAFNKNVTLTAANGANLNNIDEKIPECLVRYKFRKITVSIDGITQKTYSTYRRNGNLENVLNNIEKINFYKAKYNSFYPLLNWQYIVFGHNVHETDAARKKAQELNMMFLTKLPWDDLYMDSFPVLSNESLIRQKSGLGVACRKEYKEKYKSEYQSNCCLKLWKSPQINYDGRLLGCSINYWEDYGNILEDGLPECLNSKKYLYAKDMLEGKRKEREDIPCSSCKFYKWRKESYKWINRKNINNIVLRNRLLTKIENRLLEFKFYNRFYKSIFAIKQILKK